MKVEVLFPEFCNLYGDISNMKYLQKCIPEAEFIYTPIKQCPHFITNDVSLIYLGPMTERTQEKVIETLKPYKEKIQELINKNVVFLLTGNAVEVFGEYIENEDGSKIQGLGIFPIHAKRDMLNRYSGMVLGTYEDIEIVGFKGQFTMCYGNNEEDYFVKVKKGIGMNKESKLEGLKIHQCIATYIIGPILILNPLLTKKILQQIGVDKPQLAYEEEIMKAYKIRLEEFKKMSE